MPLGESDRQLAVQLQAGDPAALGRLYERHARDVHDFLVRLTRDPAAAEDLTHATFLRAWERRQSLRSPDKVRSWLFATAHHLGLNHLTRTPRVASIYEDAAGPLADPGHGPEEQAITRDTADMVWAAAS